ncbi:MAG: hypothetical protein KJP12_07615 [Acidimicrobiia bacterium]|nr:hypothetical protein [Acidimicrobiia bacterium]MBT8215077.1 hypothetical protein [Acidimicrobiia bacterium]NNF68366.1 hypothetical protein [Acidimicrobiia bacterium]NNK91589.1 hypothetical protein [Acidimicrobiia bacterium]
MRNLRIWVLVLALAVLAAACGDDEPFSNLGDFSRDYVHGESTSTSLVTIDPGEDDGELPEGAALSTDADWTNDTLAASTAGNAADVVAAVWTRGGGEGFVQASRAEIAAALPEIDFPELVPDQVGWVTSQLVFDPSAAALDIDTAAAFGLWAYEPYTVTRGQGQVAVLRIGILGPDEEAEPITAEPVDEGLSLTWADTGYRYELFCRTGLPDPQCWRMAETAAPLRLLLP